jgi:hypothetical protein
VCGHGNLSKTEYVPVDMTWFLEPDSMQPPMPVVSIFRRPGTVNVYCASINSPKRNPASLLLQRRVTVKYLLCVYCKKTLHLPVIHGITRRTRATRHF